MAEILYPPSRPQSVGEVLDTAFRIFGTTLLKCLPYAALAVIFGQVPTLYDVATGRPLLQSALLQSALQRRLHDPAWWLLELIALVGTVAMTNALMLRQYRLASAAAQTGGELATAVRLVPGVWLIWILVLVASVMPIGAAAGIIVPVAMGGAHGATLAAVCAVLALILLAGWLLLRWSCSVTIYVTSGRGAIASMSHSWDLTSGNFWRLSLIYTVALVLIAVLYVLSGVISAVVALVVARGDLAVITATGAVVVVLLGAIAMPFYSAMAVAVLGDLSVRKEGTDLAQRISAPAAP